VTPGPARRLTAACSGYAAILAGSWLVHRLFGAEPFASDAGFVQRIAAVLFALAGAAAYRLPALGFPVRALLASAGAWLAIDEWAMVHECLKFGPLAQLGRLRDAPILLYGIGAVAATVLVARRVRPGREPLLHAAVALLAVGGALLLDLGGIWRGASAEVVEETAELLAAWGAIRFCSAAARERPSSSRLEAALVAGWSVAWIGTAVWLLKPVVCAARFL
jgi:hypothetical protein